MEISEKSRFLVEIFGRKFRKIANLVEVFEIVILVENFLKSRF